MSDNVRVIHTTAQRLTIPVLQQDGDFGKIDLILQPGEVKVVEVNGWRLEVHCEHVH